MIYLEYLRAYGRSVYDSFLDLAYGGYYGGKVETRYRHMGSRDTLSSNYSVISCIFNKHKIKESDVLVDVGCGKGRVINWWLKKGYCNKIVGLEIDEQIAARTKRRFQMCRNVEIICGNALEKIPKDGTVFYFYNSFDRAATAEFRDRMKKIFGNKGGIKIFYVNCEHLDVFFNDREWKVLTNASRFFINTNDVTWDRLDLATSYPIAVIELRPIG